VANTLTAAAPIALVDHTGDGTRDRADTANERNGDHQPSGIQFLPASSARHRGRLNRWRAAILGSRLWPQDTLGF
jgi:hypothetical protein